MTDSEAPLSRLADVIDARHGADAQSSYVARLLGKGHDAILKKIAEEAGELIMAAKDHEHQSERLQAVINETADLWFHTLILLSRHGLRPEQVLAELARREGLSGIEEKARRSNS